MTEDSNLVHRRYRIAVAAAIFVAILFLVERLGGCSSQSNDPPAPPVDPNGNSDVTCEGGLKFGETISVACQGGTKLSVCTEQGLKVVSDTCSGGGQGGGGGGGNGNGGTGGGGSGGGSGGGGGGGGGQSCDKPSFAQVKPVYEAKCVKCHTLDKYATAKAWAPKISRRIKAGTSSDDHMPPIGEPQLTSDEVTKIDQWIGAGAPDQPDCGNAGGGQGGGGGRAFLDLQYIESAILNDLNDQVKAKTDELVKTGLSRPFAEMRATSLIDSAASGIRYLVTAHQVNQGAEPAVLETFRKAMDKGLNSVNESGRDLVQAFPIDAARTIWRFDLESYGLTANKWRVFEAADRLKVFSQTERGALIRALTITNEPWVFADNFLDVALRSKGVYYTFLGIPTKLGDYERKLGIDFADELKDAEVAFIGSARSVIAEQKNRLMTRVRTDGIGQAQDFCYKTFDTKRVAPPLAARNLTEFPLLRGTGGNGRLGVSVKNFLSDASETICTLPNGLIQFALWDGVGNRVDVAATDIVTDTGDPSTPLGDKAIVNSISCFRCHAGTTRPMVDQIRAASLATGSLGANDTQLVTAVYHSAASNNAQFNADNGFVAKALAKIGVDSGEADPINAVTDVFNLNWTVAQAAAPTLLSVDDFKACVNQSARAKAQIGQILIDGGTITHDQWIDVFPILITDCRLFQDPID